MTAPVNLTDTFQAERPRLLSLAHRILGSLEDAEDAVQDAWLRAHTVQDEIENPAGWLTTVTARLCLDLLRASRRRGELPLLADALADQQLAADEEFLRREQVSRALMVLLDQLTPTQRVAYVLHDLFRVPFDEIAGVLDTTPTNAKKLASRARQRIAGASVVETAQTSDWRVVEAFLAAARDGDIDALVGVLAPDVVRTAAPELLPDGEAVTVHGHRAVAGEARLFADRVDVTIPMVVNGVPAAVLAPGGRPLARIMFDIVDGLITRLDIAPLVPTDQLGAPAQ